MLRNRDLDSGDRDLVIRYKPGCRHRYLDIDYVGLLQEQAVELYDSDARTRNNWKLLCLYAKLTQGPISESIKPVLRPQRSGEGAFKPPTFLKSYLFFIAQLIRRVVGYPAT